MKLYATLVFFILGSASLHAADGPSVLAPVLQSFVDKRIAPGVVALVADKDGVLALDKAGYASLANKTPIRDDAVFWIASMSKSLTGTALMMLVDQGKLSAQESYGIGWSVKLTDEEGPSAGSFGHRGARRTAMQATRRHPSPCLVRPKCAPCDNASRPGQIARTPSMIGPATNKDIIGDESVPGSRRTRPHDPHDIGPGRLA